MDAMYGLSYIVPRVCWIVFLVLMLCWIIKTQNGFAYNNTKLGSQGYLNHHYVFMTTAWPICMFEAILSYRMPLYRLPHRSAHKYLHVALQTAAGIFILLGLIFVELFKRYNGENHFWSVHSWLGAIAMAMYVAQYTAGFWAYLVSRWSPEHKAAFYSVHRFLGSATLLTAFTAIVAALSECQTFGIFAKRGIKGFYTDFTYWLPSIVLPIMTLLVLTQATFVMYNLVHGQQAIPVGSSVPSAKGTNGVKASV